jgi:hypothetical protein
MFFAVKYAGAALPENITLLGTTLSFYSGVIAFILIYLYMT